MKFLALLFLVGCAAASFYDELDQAAEDVYQEFMLGLESAGSFSEAAGYSYEHPLLKRAEDETKNELAQRLRETLNEILEKMKESLENGKAVKEDLQNKAKEIREKLKELKEDVGTRARELMEKIKDRARKFWEELLEKLKGKRSVEDPMRAFEMKEIFNKLKNLLREKINKEDLKAKVENLFGKGNDMADNILKIINEKGDKYKQKLLDLVDRYLGKEEKEEVKRSISEVWEKIRDYFKNLQIDLKEKYAKFGEWVKEQFDKGMEKGKTKLDNIKKIAQELRDHTKGVSKEVAVEALEFLKPYKDDLGSLWDQVKETVKDILSRQE